MRRKRLILCILLISFTFLNANLIEFYRRGTIKLEADPTFGKSTKWEDIFLDENKKLVIAPNGAIFVSDTSLHNIFKFSQTGELVKKFGGKGRGPGDTYHPGTLSILDDKYLVVGEYAVSRRISLFDFEGKCAKILRTNHSALNPIALRKNRIAYLAYKQDFENRKSSSIQQTIVIIKDVLNGEEKVVDMINIKDKGVVFKDGTIFKLGNYSGSVTISKTKSGNLLVGISNSPGIKIYSPDGKLLHSFQLIMKPLPVTRDYIRKSKDEMLKKVRESKGGGSNYKWISQRLNAISFSKIFGDHLPYYREILIDSEGNILVFKWTDCVGMCDEIFQVYSPAGEYICETHIEEGIFNFEIKQTSGNICFTSEGIFGLFKLKDSDDISLRMVKVPIGNR